MTTIKIGGKDYKIYYAIEPTIKSKLLKKLASVEGIENWNADNFDELFVMIGEMLLIGLQKEHKDVFGYNYVTEEGKEEVMSKVYSLLDDFAADEDADFFDLFHKLQDELLENGFFAKLFRQEKEAAEQDQTSEK